MKNNKIKRQVLLELEVVEQLEKIAIEKFDAPKHPVTKNPVITDALNLILNLGLKHYYSNYKDNNSPELGDPIAYKDLDSLSNQLDDFKERLDLFTAIAASNQQSISKINKRLDLIESYKSNYIRGLLQADTKEDIQEDKKLISQEDTKEDIQEDKKLISQEDIKEDIQEDKKLISQEDTKEDIQLFPQENSQEDKPDNSPDKDPSTISYSASELAQLTGFNRNTLANWLKKGKIPRSRKNQFIIERYRMENNKFVPRKSCY